MANGGDVGATVVIIVVLVLVLAVVVVVLPASSAAHSRSLVHVGPAISPLMHCDSATHSSVAAAAPAAASNTIANSLNNIIIAK
jgi:hypothetical protein